MTVYLIRLLKTTPEICRCIKYTRCVIPTNQITLLIFKKALGNNVNGVEIHIVVKVVLLKKMFLLIFGEASIR